MSENIASQNDDFSRPHPADRMTLLRELLDELNRSAPLNVLFERAARRLYRLFRAQSVSVWQRRQDHLELAVSLGSEPSRAQIEIGFGPVGLCVATRAPVFTSGQDERLDRPPVVALEEAATYTIAAPLLVEGDATGAIAVDSLGAPLSESDAELLLALSSGIAGAIRADNARRASAPQDPPSRRAGGGTRRVVLRGKTFSPGEALGPVVALRRLPRRSIDNPRQGAARAVRAAFDQTGKAVRELSARARAEGIGRDADFLPLFEATVDDDRFREAVVEHVVRGASIHDAFQRLTGETLRAANAVNVADSDPSARQRAADLEDLFAAIAMLAHDDPRARPPRSAVLVGASLTPYDVLLTARSNPVGVVLTERTGGDRSRVLLKLLDLPSLLDVGGVTRWVSDGDIALLDATRGFLLLNPTRAEVAALRKVRKVGPS